MQFSVEKKPENLRHRQPNVKAAALHECSLGTPAAADGHAKGDAAKGVEHAKVARHSQSAASQTDQASAENKQQSNQYGARRRAQPREAQSRSFL
jgi:hypothetical protein